jgi:hypothetical protein
VPHCICGRNGVMFYQYACFIPLSRQPRNVPQFFFLMYQWEACITCACFSSAGEDSIESMLRLDGKSTHSTQRLKACFVPHFRSDPLQGHRTRPEEFTWLDWRTIVNVASIVRDQSSIYRQRAFRASQSREHDNMTM